jgi:predicted Zn-dependent protease
LAVALVCLITLGSLIGGLTAGFTAREAEAQTRDISFIRDTEIENTMRVYLAPIFDAAGLDPGSVKIHLILDDAINAFVAGGMNIFIHTGLLTNADGPGEVIGVLAHEVGHITGGHLARFKGNAENAQIQGLAAMILGGAAAIAAGEPAGVSAAVALGQQVGQRSFLSYTRQMEQSADQAAMDFLRDAGFTPRGYRDVLEKLQRRAKLYSARSNPYEQSHPVTSDRLAFVENQIANWPADMPGIPDSYTDLHQRMRAKLLAYIQDPSRTLEQFAAASQDVSARYARSIAHMRAYDREEALVLAEGLIADNPNDPFFYELKGDIFLNTGDVANAIEPYEKAVEMLPWAALIRINLARALLELNDTKHEEAALDHLLKARRYEPDSTELWRLTAGVYTRLGESGQAALAQAERAFRSGRNAQAKTYADRAMSELAEGSASWLRAQDISLQLDERERQKK